MSQTQMTEEDYLRKHLEKTESKAKPAFEPAAKQKDSSRTTDLQYQAFDVSLFPCGMFYPAGSTIQVRPALVKEIQAYSMVLIKEEENYWPAHKTMAAFHSLMIM
jgi:hypothetical protein